MTMSGTGVVVSLTKHFESLTDPRVARTRWHELGDILLIAVCGAICDCDAWEDLPRYAAAKKGWLKKFIKLENGIPSADTFARVFQRLDPDEFLRCMSSWVTALRQRLAETGAAPEEQIVAIDGKTLCGSGDAFSGSPLHLVRAWAVENHLVLGQQACAEKSNEITAIPKLLQLIELTGAIVTIDAMGCQTEIAAKIRDRGADYVLAAKNNQPTLYEAVTQEFETALVEQCDGQKPRFRKLTTRGRAHGRNEERTYYMLPAPSGLKQSGHWRDLKTIGMVIRTRTIKGHEDTHVHYYISSLEMNVGRLARAVRGHWSIENSLHWMLDVNFAEDASRIRKGSSPQIASLLRQLALMILKQDTSSKEKTIRGKRKIAGWNDRALESLLLNATAL